MIALASIESACANPDVTIQVQAGNVREASRLTGKTLRFLDQIERPELPYQLFELDA